VRTIPSPPPATDDLDASRLVLRDGTTATVRAASAQDRDALRRFFHDLSPGSRRNRFFAAGEPPQAIVDRFAESFEDDHALTLVACRHVDGEVRISRDVPGSGEEALAVLKPGALFGEMAVFDRTERSTHAISNGGTTVLTISRPDFEMMLDFNRELAYKVLWACVRLLSSRLRSTNDSLRSFLAMSMF